MDFNNTSGIRSPFSPRVRQPITGRGSANKQNSSQFQQSQDAPGGEVIYKTPSFTVETYGTPLPVMVTEALTFAHGDVSVRLYSCDWCCVVSGRRVLAWPVAAAAPPAARELTLPQTDLAHKADLVAIFYEDGAQIPSCIGVSPEGIVRYWPSVGQEGVYADVSAELAGQECERLGDQSRMGLVLATTTCTVVVLNPAVVEGRATVRCRTLRPPSGWLGGIGRRVSLLFFGSMPQQADTKLVGVVVLEDDDDADEESPPCVALVGGGGGGGPLLQLWRGPELHAHCLRRALQPHTALLPAQGEPGSAEMSALEVRGSGGRGLLLLLAAGPPPPHPDLRYAIAHISVEEPSSPRVSWVAPLRLGAEPELPRFLPLDGQVLLYSSTYIALVSMGGAEKWSQVEVSRGGVVCAAAGGGGALLFAARHGVLRLRTRRLAAAAPPPPCHHHYADSLALYEIDPHEVSSVTTDVCGKLKTAFLFHVRRDAAACRSLLAAQFPPDAADTADAALDRAVLRVAADILDDMPAGDPRWKQRVTGQSANIALGSSAALDIAAQLRDKQRAFTLFVDFLRHTGLAARLQQVTDESSGQVVSTESALCSLSQRLAAAVALRRLQRPPHQQRIEHAIYQAVSGSPWAESLGAGALSAADVCYREVTHITRVLRALAAADNLDILTTVVSEMQAAAAGWPCRAPPAPLLPALLDMHRRTFTQYLPNCQDATARATLLESAATLADLLLSDGAGLPPQQYQRMRTQLLQPFVEEGQIERAAALAEKFKDFELLVEMCVTGGELERLYGYIDKYMDEGMCELSFAWLCERPGRLRATLLRTLGQRYPARLVSWLSSAPAPPRPALLALQQLSSRQHRAAAAAYAALADNETDSLGRMTTMASLAKLCLLASDDSQPGALWARAERRLALAEQQAALPRDVKVHNGLDAEDTRVLPPEDLVQMYISSDSASLSEYDYKKALDLTDYVADMERRDDLRLRVWCACAARDDWSCDAEPELQRYMFFRLADLVHLMGGDLQLLLPAAEDVLTARELADLASEPRFHYLIKYGYECLRANHDQ